MRDKQNMNQSAVIAGAGFVLSALAARRTTGSVFSVLST